MKIYIWGTGKTAAEYMKMGEVKAEDLRGFIETKKTKESFMGKRVYEPHELKDEDFDYILVCVLDFSSEIYKTCRENGFSGEKLIFSEGGVWEWLDGSSMGRYPFHLCRRMAGTAKNAEQIFPQLFRRYKWRETRAKRFIAVQMNGYHLKHRDSALEEKEFMNSDYWSDYFRFRSFELMANEIRRKNVQGAVAELGVFRGTFSKLINRKFNDRKLYLFDTFSSFSADELAREVEAGHCDSDFLEGFKDTSEEMVLEKMAHREMCEVRKGLFPETAIGLERETYAFVSIDVDFEASVLEGLRYFYPRLNEGGIIFLHDYNNYFLEGVRAAVERYENETGCCLTKVPLADEGGTLVICKPGMSL